MDAAGWRCVCGAVAFEVHHVDGDPSNNDPDNLRPLCKGCHLSLHDRLAGQPKAMRWRELVRGT